jgi:hypothetical protein
MGTNMIDRISTTPTANPISGRRTAAITGCAIMFLARLAPDAVVDELLLVASTMTESLPEDCRGIFTQPLPGQFLILKHASPHHHRHH